MKKRWFVALLPLVLVGAGCAKTKVDTTANANVSVNVKNQVKAPTYDEPEVIDTSVETYVNTKYGYQLNKLGYYLFAYPAVVKASEATKVKLDTLGPTGGSDIVNFTVGFYPMTLEEWRLSFVAVQSDKVEFQSGTLRAVSMFQGHKSIEYWGREDYDIVDAYRLRAIEVEGGVLVVQQNAKSDGLDVMYQSFTFIK
ncbi:hypothetical protein HY633_01635 [Candidatus Uhrbacteria bacterium]|nr:hypothetical protein [Candidatus Uhrbacteria bacterium]